MDYIKGLEQARKILGDSPEVTRLFQELELNIEHDRRYGSTEQTRSNRLVTVDILNGKVLRATGNKNTFNQLCM